VNYKKNHKYLIFLFILFYICPIQAENKILYIDVNYIMNNSLAGKSINKQLIEKNKKNVTKFKKIEEKLISEESKIIAQKNILNEDEYKKKILLFKKKISDFKIKKKEAINDFSKKKIEAKNLLINTLSPIVANYAKENSAAIIIDKKNIVIGKTEFDITANILKILDSNIKNIKLN
jgi:outer membrane protein